MLQASLVAISFIVRIYSIRSTQFEIVNIHVDSIPSVLICFKEQFIDEDLALPLHRGKFREGDCLEA